MKIGNKLICTDDKPMMSLIKKGNKYEILEITEYLVWILVEGHKMSIDQRELEYYWKLDLKPIRKEKLKKLLEVILFRVNK